MDAWRHRDDKTKLSRVGFGFLVVLGALYPACVVGIELTTRMCARDLFDPMPTWLQVVLVSLVPATNFVIWLRLRRALYSDDPNVSSALAAPALLFFSGLSIGVAALYTILFLPITPLAVIAIPAYGLGLLPLAPMASLIAAVILFIGARRRAAEANPALRWPRAFWAGTAVAVTAVLAQDARPALTRIAIQMALSDSTETQDRGIAILRAAGDRELLLRFCYVGRPSPAGVFSMIVSNFERPPTGGRVPATTGNLRLVYYRVTGEPFNLSPMPSLGMGSRIAPFADFDFDADQGGKAVGGRLSGLSVTSSRLDGSISGDDATAYLEWTLEITNSAMVSREARMQLALPPGAVVSRATLWINGEEREAAYGERGRVREAYENVVKVRRDPLLVTSTGAGRVLAQAFPVFAQGKIKFKLGITAPLELIGMDKARLTLPAIDDRNFNMAADFKHTAWIESKRPIGSSSAALTPAAVDGKIFRLRGDMSDRELELGHPVISVERDPAVVKTWGQLKDGRPVIQEIVSTPKTAPAALLVLVDGSVNMKPHAEAIARVLAEAPASVKVGLMIASEQKLRFAPADWIGGHKEAALAALRGANFAGGQDNADTLADGLFALEPFAGAKLLWVHASQPETFPESATKLEQAASRLARLPDVSLYAVEPGRNDALPDAPWTWRARRIAATGAVETDLKAHLENLFGTGAALEIRRTQGEAPEGVERGSEHIVRLWAHDQVMTLAGPAGHTGREEAVKLAAAHHLVTPVTGAVVLENKAQFDQNSLEAAKAGTVPGIPEPRTWLMLIMAGALLLWIVLRRREREGSV